MFGLLDLAKVFAGAAIGALVGYNAGWTTGSNYGYDKHVAEIAIADGAAEMKRKGDDAELQNMDDYNLCVVGLRSNGMPVDACELLRGVRTE